MGKTSSGPKVTFNLRASRRKNFVGAEPMRLWFGINRTVEFDAKLKPAFYYNQRHRQGARFAGSTSS